MYVIPELCPSGPAYLSNANAGARDQQHQSRKCHQAWKVKGNIAPARRNSLSRVERFIAITTQDEGCTVVQHFALYFGDERLDGRAVARHGLQMQKKRPRRRQVGVGAFVERAAFVFHAARNHSPQTIEILQADEPLEPPHGGIGRNLPRREIENGCAIVGDHGHLTVRKIGNGNRVCRRFTARRLAVRPCRNRERAEQDRDRNLEAKPWKTPRFPSRPCASHGPVDSASIGVSEAKLQRPLLALSRVTESGATSMRQKDRGPASIA
jgi:hypothetical protein